jgi:hypothetical protein
VLALNHRLLLRLKQGLLKNKSRAVSALVNDERRMEL